MGSLRDLIAFCLLFPIIAVLYFAIYICVVYCFCRRQPNNDTGLDPTVMAFLPTFIFKRREDQSQNDVVGDEDSSVIQCCVCLSNLEDQETARVLPNCKHVFHVACIDTWLASHSTCPICRTNARPLNLIEPLPREGPIGTQTVDAGGAQSGGGSISRLSFIIIRRILPSRERSSRRIRPSSSSSSSTYDLERQ